MASRKSGFYNSEYYKTTRRGRTLDGDMSFDMFPEKYETTAVQEDPNELYNHNRQVIKDYTPDHGNMLASDETTRDKHSREKLRLREGGARTLTMPYSNNDNDTQFHDSDPRGWSVEQPWQEYRRQLEAQMNRTDFKDDGDYSVPSAGIHPNTMYSQIRGAQDWVKARLKIFSTSKDNFHNGGIGKYKWYHKSDGEKVDFEETSVNIDQRYDSFAERQNKTSELSNIVNLGSKMLRTNTTTDQLVTVSSYGKLMRQKGLIPHETQLRIVEDDTRWGKVKTGAFSHNNVASYMSAEVNRESMQAAVGDKAKFTAAKEDESKNRNAKLTGDIIGLMGFTENEVKYLESAAANNVKTAKLALAQLHGLTELLHATPAHLKLTLRDELVVSGVRGPKATSDGGRAARNEVVLNPKIVEYMKQSVRKNADRTANPENLLREAVADSEGKLNHKLAGQEVFVYKSTTQDDLSKNRNETDAETKKAKIAIENIVSYKNFSKHSQNVTKNQHEGLQMQDLADSKKMWQKMGMLIGDTKVADVKSATTDNNFGENLTKTRHIGAMGTKSALRRSITADTPSDTMSDTFSVSRKTTK